jgi:glycosyltransferase involved in cell wall biosynthesis
LNLLLLSEVSAIKVIGGAERVLREQALGLRRRGHQVATVVRMPTSDPRPLVAIGGLVEHRYVVSRRSEPAFVLSSLMRSIQAFDLAYISVPAEAVVIHQSLGGLGALLARRKKARGWVYVCHSLAHEEYLSRTAPGGAPAVRARRALNARARLWCEGLVLRRCDRIVVLSEFMKRRIVGVHRVAADRICVIPGGADPVQFHPPSSPDEVRRSLGLPLNKVLLLTVRNLVPRMGLEHLVRAVAALGGEAHDLLLLIGGEGVLRSALERLIRDLNLGQQVRLLGFIAEDHLSFYYQAADLVLMPTHELEGFGLVTVEAMACGTPVLGTPAGALPEVLAQVDPRLIAEGTGPEALAVAMERLLRRFRDMPGEQARLSDRGRTLVETDFNWDRHTERLEAVLREACA